MAHRRYRDTSRSGRISRRIGARWSRCRCCSTFSNCNADRYAATGQPGQALPSGWMVTAAKFEVEWPAEAERSRLVRSHFGARRKALNWGLALVIADLDAKTVDPAHESVGWEMASLRKAWNRAKH